MPEDNEPLGPTGTFPEGKLYDADQGALRMGIGVNRGHVYIEFGTNVGGMAMGPDKAEDFAFMILKCAREARNGT